MQNQLLKELLNALESENIRLVKLLLKSEKVECNDWIGDSGVTIVHLVAGHKTESFATTLINLLINDGADPNVPSSDQITPVHVAAGWGNVSVLKILLLHGGNPWIQDYEKRNAHNYAFESKAWAVVELLHNFQLANSAHKKEKKIGPIQKLYQNAYNTSVTATLKEELGEVFIEHCSNKITSKNIFVSSAEIIPVTVKELVFNASDIHFFNEVNANGNPAGSSQFSTKNLKIKCNDSDTIENVLSQTYTVEKPYSEPSRTNSFLESFTAELAVKSESDSITNIPSQSHTVEKTKCPETLQSNLFSELLAAVKRRSDRLATPDLSNNINSPEMARMAMGKMSISDEENQCKVIKKSENGQIKDGLTISSCSDESFGNDVKLLILESGKDDVQIVDISDTGSSFFSLTDCEENSLVSTSSFNSCFGSPGNSESKKCNDDDADRIRSQLLAFGVNAGPITPTTKDVYVRVLRRLEERGFMINAPTTNDGHLQSATVSYLNNYCRELEEAITDTSILKQYAILEASIRKDFDNPTRTWRGGSAKTSFNYLLLDSRKTRNLPERASETTNPIEITREFLNAIFYVGKGQGRRPYDHLHGAFQSWQHGSYPKDPKEASILDIWGAGAGVVCLQIFHNTIPAEALTREAAMIDALGRQHVRNLRRGEYYGVAAHWTPQQKRTLGAFLLLTSKDSLLRDGERVLRPCDL